MMKLGEAPKNYFFGKYKFLNIKVESRIFLLLKYFRSNFLTCYKSDSLWNLRSFLVVPPQICASVCLTEVPINKFCSLNRNWIPIYQCWVWGSSSIFIWFVLEWILNESKITWDFEANLLPSLTNISYHCYNQLIILLFPTFFCVHQYSTVSAVAHTQGSAPEKFGNFFPLHLFFLNQFFQ